MSRFLYLLLLIAAAVFYPLYEDKLSYILLLAVIFLPLLMAAELIASAALMRLGLKKNEAVIFKGGEGEIEIDLSNRSVFPLSGVKVAARIVYHPSGNSEIISADIPLPALSSRTVTVNIAPENCVEAEVYLEYVRVSDLLRLFSLKLFKNAGFCGRLFIVPRISEKYASLAREIMEKKLNEGANESESAADSGAFGDIAGYRELRPGDRLSRIHHKLSARFDRDMVRIMSASESGCFLLTADLTAEMGDDGLKSALEMRDSRLEKLLSIAYYLSEEGGQVHIAVPEEAALLGECVQINGTSAMQLGGAADYMTIAKALAGADFYGPLPRSSDEYTTIRIDRTEDNNEEDK